MQDPLLGVEPALLAAIAFVFGALNGSFLSTVLIRWPAGSSAVGGRSSCDSCGKTLRAHELVPILSFLLARGRCRSCDGTIDARHLGVELAAGLIGAISLYAHPNLMGCASALLGWWLLLLGALDAEHHWLPDRLTLPLLVAGLGLGLLGIGPPLEQRLIGAAIGFASLALIAFAYRKLRGRCGLGGGDPKLFAALGAWVGWVQLPFVLLGAGLLGLAAILSARLRGRRIEATDRMPLGTLLALAAWPIWLLLPY